MLTASDQEILTVGYSVPLSSLVLWYGKLWTVIRALFTMLSLFYCRFYFIIEDFFICLYFDIQLRDGHTPIRCIRM